MCIYVRHESTIIKQYGTDDASSIITGNKMKSNDDSLDVFRTNKHKRVQYMRWATLDN